MLREFEETNKHGFDNRLGDKHVVGTYRWVDKIMENNLINYGKRLLYDFAVPEASKNFKKWMEERAKKALVTNLKEPNKPADFGIVNATTTDSDNNQITAEWASINEGNYAAAAAEYGADVDPCLPLYMTVGKEFSNKPTSDNLTNSTYTDAKSDSISIPDNYYAYSAIAKGSFTYHGGSIYGPNWHLSHVTVSFGNHVIWCGAVSGQSSADIMPWQNTFLSVDAFEKEFPVSYAAYDVAAMHFNVIVKVKRKKEAYQAWQQATYIAIITAYNKKLEEYNNATAASQPSTNEQIDYNFNPLNGRAIEQRELRRLCIELMLEPFGIRSGKDNYIQDPCTKVYHINKNAAFEKHSEYVRFLEEAFQWDLMSYFFYPYYWADEKEWKNLITEKSSSDPLFQTFLQSGMARVTVPVRINFEFAVAYFLNTGKIWKSNNIIAAGKDKNLYLSIDELLRYDEGKPEATWHTRIPTDLTILQNDTSPLDEKGLPCEWSWKQGKKVYCENGEPIANDPTNVLSGINPSVAVNSGLTTDNGAATVSRFTFTKHPTLLVTDIGKLVVNEGDGLARVAKLSAELPEQFGLFSIKLDDINQLSDRSELKIKNSSGSWSFSRIDWRNGNVPTTALDELTLIRDYIQSQSQFSYLTLSIFNNDLVIEELVMSSTKIKYNDFPFASIRVNRASRPISPAAVTGLPLGKLIGIEGNNAVISNEPIETYTLTAPITINNDLFNADAELDFYSASGVLEILNHVMVAADDGKVQPVNLAFSDFNSDILNTYRNQIVGIAIGSAGTEVKVIKLAYVSHVLHLFRRAFAKGILGND